MSGYSVSNATKYHITYSSDGGYSWTSAAGPADNHSASSITISGVDNAKSYIVGVRAGNDSGQWSGWRNSASIAPLNPPPAAPSSVSVSRAHGTLTASGYTVSNATKYHITYSSDGGQNWTAASDSHAASSITISGVKNGASYIVGVRAGNAAGWSGWTNSASIAPFNPAPTAPATPSSVSVSRADGTLTVSGYAVSGATKYHITYSSDNMQSWTAASDNHAENSITISGVDNAKTYYIGVRAGNAGGWSGWTNSAAAGPPPAAPSNLSVTPGDGYLDIAWDAVSDATAYDVRAKKENSNSWHSVAAGVTGASHRYTTSETIDYIGVRATNANGSSAWAEISRAPAQGWLTTMQQSGGASAQSVNAQSQLAAPASITVTRDNDPRDENLRVSWDAVSGASGYNLTCSFKQGWAWWQCGSITSGSTTTHTVSNGPNGTPLAKERSYLVAVRAVTSVPADASNWTTSANVRPVYGYLRNIVIGRGNGSITLSWTPNFWTTGYQIDCAVSGEARTRCATLTNQDDTAAKHSVTISTWTAGGTNYSINDTKTYDVKIISTNAWGQDEMLAPLVRPVTLEVSNVTTTTATLSINFTDAWWYQRTVPSDSTCHSVTAGTQTVNLASLTGGEAYSYTAYNDSTCTTSIAPTATFITTASVSNLGQASDTVGSATYTGRSAANSFTTGNSGTGYTLHDVTIPILYITGSPGDLTVAIHAESSGQPAASATHTLSGSTPTATGDYTFTCSGACQLSASTTYFVVVSAVGNTHRNSYGWDTTASAGQANDPSGFGWTIADQGLLLAGGYWSTPSENYANRFKVTATVNRTLTVSDIGTNSATLTIAGHTGNWYYKYTSPAGGTCSSAVGTTTASVSGLDRDTAYTFAAYRDAGCTALLTTADSFTTLANIVVSVSNLSETASGSLFSVGGSTGDYAQQFTTGANSGGYTLSSVTLDISVVFNAIGFTLAIHDVQSSGNNAGQPATTARATLSGTAAAGQTTFTCSSNCDLAASTSYFVYLSAVNANAVYLPATASNTETGASGWSIADALRYEQGSWALHASDSLKIKVTATEK